MAQEPKTTSAAINRLIAHCDPQIDENNNSIPNSGWFSGNVPRHMVTELTAYAEGHNARIRDERYTTLYNWREQTNASTEIEAQTGHDVPTCFCLRTGKNVFQFQYLHDYDWEQVGV